MLLMCPLIRAGYQDVIQIDKHIVQVCQYLVHQPLECLACIPKSKQIHEKNQKQQIS